MFRSCCVLSAGCWVLGTGSLMLEARDLEKTYRMGRVTLPVLRGISLRVAPGKFLAIMGPSGAGKSTLLHLLAGLDTPTRGEVLWDGRSVSGLSDARRAAFRNEVIGMVFQFYHLLPGLTALENVMLPGLVNGRRSTRELRARATACLEHVRLESRMQHRPAELSGGEQQRVAIARALINQPKVLLCDEPTGNLDSATGASITALLTDLYRRERLGLILVTHDAALAEQAGQRLTLRDGRIVEEFQRGDAPRHPQREGAR